MEQLLQFPIANVTGGNQEQFVGLMTQQEHVDKIFVLGDDRSLLSHGKVIDCCVPGAIPLGQILRVKGIMTLNLQPSRQSVRELGIDQELHYSAACTRLT